MASISSLGVGSGLDLSSIVTGLVDAERAPTENRLDFKEETINTKLSAFGALKSSLSLFQGTLSNVQAASTYNTRQAALSDDTVFGVTVGSSANTGSYAVEVTELAASHSLASNATSSFTTVDEVIGTGTLTIRFGTTTTGPYAFTHDTAKPTEVITVSAANGNNTLSGFRDYINNNDLGVQASIIHDGTGYRLTLTSENSGAGNSMEITVTGDGDGLNNDNDGLSQLAYNASAQGSMLKTVDASDAALSINGLAITRETNTVSGAIDGVTLDLKKKDVGNIVNLSISDDNSSIVSAIQEFVEGFNGLTETISTLTAYDTSTEEAGLLIGDSTVRNLSSQLRSLVTNSVTNLDGNIRALSDIGITTQANGKLEINTSTLNAAVNNSAEAVEALFRPLGQPTDNEVEYISSTSNTRAGDYAVFINSLASQGVYNGTTANSLNIGASNDSFTLKVDGTTSNPITLTQALYGSGEALATHMQAQINSDAALKAAGVSVQVAYDTINGEFDITSARYGSESTVEFVAVDTTTQNDLGFAVGKNGADGTNINGTINGQSATGDGQILTSAAGNSSGLALLIDSGATGVRGTVGFSKGIIQSINELLDSYLESDGLISARENGLNSELEEISEDRQKLEVRISNLEARLVAQFATLDALIARFNNTSSFLTQQLANLPEPNSTGRDN